MWYIFMLSYCLYIPHKLLDRYSGILLTKFSKIYISLMIEVGRNDMSEHYKYFITFCQEIYIKKVLYGIIHFLYLFCFKNELFLYLKSDFILVPCIITHFRNLATLISGSLSLSLGLFSKCCFTTCCLLNSLSVPTTDEHLVVWRWCHPLLNLLCSC